jgi:hypothetical protein
MMEQKYRVIVDKQVYARDMDLTTALTLTEALFNKWHSEPTLAITIEREEDMRCEMVEEDRIEVSN